MFRGAEAGKNHERVTKRKAVSWLVEETSYYLSRSLNGWKNIGFTYKDYVAALRNRRVELPRLPLKGSRI
jgi:hypothetical protein